MSELGLTDHELAVMEELWRLGAATIRQVTVAIHTDPNTAKYATVQRQLDRLEGKGFIRRRKTTWKNEFEPILRHSRAVTSAIGRSALLRLFHAYCRQPCHEIDSDCEAACCVTESH